MEEAGRVAFVGVNKREHFSVTNTLSRCHPLIVASSIPSTVPFTVSVIDISFNRGCEGFESSVWMLGKPWDFRTMVHPIVCTRVEIHTISYPRSFAFAIASWISILVIDKKEERAWRRKWER